jgi:hypothetical protein
MGVSCWTLQQHLRRCTELNIALRKEVRVRWARAVDVICLAYNAKLISSMVLQWELIRRLHDFTACSYWYSPVWQRVGRILPRPRPACRKRRQMAVTLRMNSLSPPSVDPICWWAVKQQTSKQLLIAVDITWRKDNNPQIFIMAKNQLVINYFNIHG